MPTSQGTSSGTGTTSGGASSGTGGSSASSGSTVETGGRTYNIVQRDGQYSADGGKTWASNALDSTKAARTQEAVEARSATSAAEQERIQYASFASNQARGVESDQLTTARLAATAHDRDGRTKYPYYTDASGRKWTEPELAAYADPTQAAALRYASAVNAGRREENKIPVPTIKPRAGPYTDEDQYTFKGSPIFLPDTRPQDKLTSVRQAEAVKTTAIAMGNFAETAAGRSEAAYTAAREKEEAFAAKYPSTGGKPYQLKDAEEAYTYTMDRAALERDTGPFYATGRAEYITAGTRSRTANRLIDTYNSQINALTAKEDYAEWKTGSYTEPGINLFGVQLTPDKTFPGGQEAKYATGKKEAVSLDRARDTLALNFAIGSTAGAKAGSVAGGPGAAVGGLAGGAGGILVGTGQVLGGYAQVAAEEDVYVGAAGPYGGIRVRDLVKPAKDQVFVKGQNKEEMAFGVIPVWRGPGEVQPLFSPTKEGGVLGTGWELNPDLDLLGSTKMKAAMTPEEYFRTPGAEKNYELVGRGDYFAMKSAWGATSGGLAGAAIAPSVITKAAELSMKPLPGPLGSWTEAIAGIHAKPGTVITEGAQKGAVIGKDLPETTRVIVSDTRSVNIGDAIRRGVNFVKPGTMKLVNPKVVTYEVQSAAGAPKGGEIPIIKGSEGSHLKGVTLRSQESTFDTVSRTGSPIRQGSIDEKPTSLIARFKALVSKNEPFAQVFKTTTVKGEIPLKDSGRIIASRGTSDATEAYGVGWGTKVSGKPATPAKMDLSSKNLLEWGMKPAQPATPDVIQGTNLGFIKQSGQLFRLDYTSTGSVAPTPGGAGGGGSPAPLISPPSGTSPTTPAGGLSSGTVPNVAPSGSGSTAQLGQILGAQGQSAQISHAAPTIPVVAATRFSPGGMAMLTTGSRAASLTATHPPIALEGTSPPVMNYGRAGTVQRIRVKTREELTPAIGDTATLSASAEAVTIPRTRYAEAMAVTGAIAVARHPGAYQERMAPPISASIQELTPATRTQLAPGATQLTPSIPPGYVPRLPPYVPPPPPPPGLGGLPNIPLGLGERDRLGGVKRSRSPSPRYAPSVTASVFNVFTTKPQKATGWSGVEVRPLVVPKKGTIIDHPYGKTGSKKGKKTGGGSRGANYYTVNPKLGLDSIGIRIGRRKK
jgi:hypothetical protein